MKIFSRSLLLCFFAYLLICFSVCAEDPGFRSKVVYRKIAVNNNTIKTLGIKTEKVEEKILDETIQTTGQIEEILKNHFDVNSSVQGVIKSVLVDLGDAVTVGQSLAVIKSTEIAKLQAEIGQLMAELELAKSYYEREKSLFEQGISPKKDFEASKTSLASTEAKLTAAESNLKILTGLSPGSEQGEFVVKTQKAGIITERNIAVGQVVNPNQILVRGVNLSTVWANADIYEKDFNKVTLGQKITVTLDGIQNKTFEGSLTYIGSLINKDARTLPVKATLDNRAGLLKPGAFIQLLIHTGQKKKSILIPRTALVGAHKRTPLQEEDIEGEHEHVVYIQEKNLFIPRKVIVEPHDSNTALVVSGLMDGEIIVTQGAYQLQYAKGKIEEKK